MKHSSVNGKNNKSTPHDNNSTDRRRPTRVHYRQPLSPLSLGLQFWTIRKGQGFPYLLPTVEPKADPGVQAVSPQVTISHPPGGRLPIHSVRPAVTFPAAEHHCPLASTKSYCLVTEAHRFEQLAQDCYTAFAPSRI